MVEEIIRYFIEGTGYFLFGLLFWVLFLEVSRWVVELDLVIKERWPKQKILGVIGKVFAVYMIIFLWVGWLI